MHESSVLTHTLRHTHCSSSSTAADCSRLTHSTYRSSSKTLDAQSVKTHERVFLPARAATKECVLIPGFQTQIQTHNDKKYRSVYERLFHLTGPRWPRCWFADTRLMIAKFSKWQWAGLRDSVTLRAKLDVRVAYL